MSLQPLDPNFESRVHASFERQGFMKLIGARLIAIAPGACEIQVPHRPELTQQHGFFHAGVIGAIADNAGGYAAYSLMPADASILTVEYKLNLLAPGDGELLLGKGQVLKAGRTLTVCRTEVFVAKADKQTLCATSLMTLIALTTKVGQSPA
jgi:uncharacterized protein (TIGR00369 family)